MIARSFKRDDIYYPRSFCLTPLIFVVRLEEEDKDSQTGEGVSVEGFREKTRGGATRLSLAERFPLHDCDANHHLYVRCITESTFT